MAKRKRRHRNPRKARLLYGLRIAIDVERDFTKAEGEACGTSKSITLMDSPKERL
jgi:hypothetical protein